MVITRKWKKSVVVGFAASALMSTAFAIQNGSTTCYGDFRTGKAFQVGDPSSAAVIKNQAKNTWQDWIWRGPTRKCTANSGNKCTYTWTQANTKTYMWNVGGGIDGGKVPIIGGILSLLSVNGSYGREKSYTESFGWQQTFDGGVLVQPVQVVERRWIDGDFKGTYWRTGSSCSELVSLGQSWSDKPGAYYWWEANYRWGKWSTNAEQQRYGMYHWWKG